MEKASCKSVCVSLKVYTNKTTRDCAIPQGPGMYSKDGTLHEPAVADRITRSVLQQQAQPSQITPRMPDPWFLNSPAGLGVYSIPETSPEPGIF